MNRVLVVPAAIVTTLGTATAAKAQTAVASTESPFRFQFEPSTSTFHASVQTFDKVMLEAPAPQAP